MIIWSQQLPITSSMCHDTSILVMNRVGASRGNQ